VVDNVVSRRVIHEQIMSWGMRDGMCATGPEAVDAVKTAQASGDPYHIVIADQDVSSVEGLTLAASLRRDPGGRDLVYVMLASISRLIDHDALPELGIDACVVKPVRQARLISTLATAWTSRRAMGLKKEPVSEAAPVFDVAVRLPQFSAHVLVVEDNLVNQKVAVALLSRLGVRADIANDGREAITRVKAHTYDLVLMDCQMPGMNGYDATVEIRKLDTAQMRVPIVAMTADVIDGSKERAFEAGMDDFVAKPVDIQDLSRALRTWLKKAA
jgi:CheY-like chemotaxis protein